MKVLLWGVNGAGIYKENTIRVQLGSFYFGTVSVVIKKAVINGNYFTSIQFIIG
jgi:hypothetical protein